MNREKVTATISDMPQDFDMEVLREKLIFIEKGLEQLNSGNMLTHEKVKQRVKPYNI